MRHIKFIPCLIGLLLPIVATAAALAEEMTGKEIIDEVTKRHARPVEYEVQKLTLTDSKGNKEVRDLKRYSRTVGPGEQRFLMVFHSPPEIRGTATITWKRRFKKDGQWVYFPSTGGKPVRIANGGKKNFVMGTDFTTEDLAPESSDKLSFKRLKDERLDGKDHFVIDVTPKDADLKAETGYKRRRLWIDKKNYFLMRTDFYDWRDTLIKRRTASDISRIEDDMWRAATHLMENFKANHTTRVRVVERSFEESAVPLELFFERTLTTGDHVR